jgi:seryl-tRNA synthetase
LIDLHLEQGYQEVYTPFVVKESVLWASGQLPKFRDNLYRDEESGLWLVPTAEVPLTSLYADEILEASQLPIYHVAYTPCFRKEQLSAGRDVRGIKRGHQFDKVEMYMFVTPDQSYQALEKLRRDAEECARRLGLPFRTKLLCTGDLGFGSAKTYDIEVWAPGVGEWLEVSSCSNVEAFQARRANLRYRPEPGAKPEFLHTLNGSGLGLPRTIIAIMENYQQEDGSILIPEVLRPYMGGMERIGP